MNGRLNLSGLGGQRAQLVDELLTRASRRGQTGPRYHRSVTRIGWFAWSWRIVDESQTPHPVLASGTARTQGRAWNRAEAAYSRLLVDAEKQRQAEKPVQRDDQAEPADGGAQ